MQLVNCLLLFVMHSAPILKSNTQKLMLVVGLWKYYTVIIIIIIIV